MKILLLLLAVAVHQAHSQACRDLYGGCSRMRAYCTNAAWRNFMRHYCAQTCNFCAAPTPDPNPNPNTQPPQPPVPGTFFETRVGEHDRRSNDGNEQDIQVSRIFKHPSYSRRVINNDIALLKLSKPAKYGKYVSPVCLPQHGADVPVGTHCYITGKFYY
eukprot:gene2362-18002_t